MTIIRSIRANVYKLILGNDVFLWNVMGSYRPDDGHVIDRNM